MLFNTVHLSIPLQDRQLSAEEELLQLKHFSLHSLQLCSSSS